MIEPLTGERQPNETDKAVLACNDYLRMGVKRSLDKLRQSYAETTSENAPTKTLRTLQEWSSRFGWVERSSAYDAAQDEAKTAEIHRLRTEGLAADYERIRQLGRIWQALDDEFKDGKGIWYKDIKMSAKGDTVDVDVFNAALLTQMRGVLDDLSKEVGGRRQGIEHTGKNGEAIRIKLEFADGMAVDVL